MYPALLPHYYRTITALLPHYYHTITALLPHYYRTITALLPHYYHTITALLPHYYRTITALLPHYYHTITALLPHYYRTITALLPHYYRTITAIFLHCPPSAPFIHTATKLLSPPYTQPTAAAATHCKECGYLLNCASTSSLNSSSTENPPSPRVFVKMLHLTRSCWSRRWFSTTSEYD